MIVRYTSDIAEGVDGMMAEAPPFISLRQALLCYAVGIQPRYDSELALSGWPVIDSELTVAQMEFLLACSDRRLIVGGQFCRVKIPSSLMTFSPEETRIALRKLPREALTISQVTGNWKLKPHSWQLDGIVWEHNLLIQYNWDGAPCDGLPSCFDRRTRDWWSEKGKEAEFTAFCGVEIECESLRSLIKVDEPYKLEIARHNLTQHNKTKNDRELKSVLQQNNSAKTQKKSRAGRPKQYEDQLICEWLLKQHVTEKYSKASAVLALIEVHFGSRQTPSEDSFRKMMRQNQKREKWMIENVKTYARSESQN